MFHISFLWARDARLVLAHAHGSKNYRVQVLSVSTMYVVIIMGGRHKKCCCQAKPQHPVLIDRILST